MYEMHSGRMKRIPPQNYIKICWQVFEIFGTVFNKVWHVHIMENSIEILKKKNMFSDILPTKKQTRQTEDATEVIDK